MAAVISVPTLSSAGWIDSPAEKIDYLMVAFVYTIKNQTSIFGNSATSLQAILETAGNDMSAVVSGMRSALITYLGRYYDSVNVDVSYALTDPVNSSSLTTVTIDIQVTENGKTYSVEQQLQLIDGKFQSFIDITSA